MAAKKDNTRKMILSEAYKLFAEKGFNAVTMKDICEATGLSRGGLYAHFSGTREIFEAILSELDEIDEVDYSAGIKEGVPAEQVLSRALEIMKKEMTSSESSLSLAMYEYAAAADREAMQEFVTKGKRVWAEIIEYGVSRGEFNPVDTEEIVNLLMFAYQGVRMWSRIIEISPEMTESIIGNIKKQLIKNY